MKIDTYIHTYFVYMEIRRLNLSRNEDARKYFYYHSNIDPCRNNNQRMQETKEKLDDAKYKIKLLICLHLFSFL